jgi:hypothetical protein
MSIGSTPMPHQRFTDIDPAGVVMLADING